MKVFAVAILAAALAVSDAACPNQCNGRGRCTNYEASYTTSATDHPYKPAAAGGNINALGYDTSKPKKDSCTCYLREEDGINVYAFTGYDCGDYTCPAGTAYNALPNANNDHTQKVECSNVGICNKANGKCECQKGFTGKACNRRTCPNNCNNRGRCLSMAEITELIVEKNANLDWTSTGLDAYAAWDKDISFGCMCDAGFRGADCSKMECPSGADPMGGKGAADGKECSGRGNCDFDTGTCQCHQGFTGTDCTEQSTAFN